MGAAKHKHTYYRTLASQHAKTIREQRRVIALQRELLKIYTGAGASEPLPWSGNPFDPEGKYSA